MKLRLGHAASFSDPAGSLVDILWEDSTDPSFSNPLVNNVVYGAFEGRYREFDPGELDLLVTSPDGEVTFADLINLDTSDGQVISAFLIGDDVNQPINMIVFIDDSFGWILTSLGPNIDKSRLQVANFSTHTFGPNPLDIALNGVNYVTDFEYGFATDSNAKYAIKPSGNYNVTVSETGSNLTLVGRNITLERDRAYKIVTAGNDEEQPLQVLVYDEPINAPSIGKARIQFYNLMPLSSEIADTAVDLVDDSGVLLSSTVNDVQFSELQSFEIDPGLLNFRIVSSDGSLIYFDPEDISVSAGDVLSIFAIGDDGSKPFSAYLAENGDSGRFLEPESSVNPPERVGYISLAFLASLNTNAEVRLGGNVLLTDAEFGDSVPYREFPVGTYPLELFVNNSNTPIFSTSVSVLEDVYQSGFISGNNAAYPLQLKVAEDDLSRRANGSARIRFGNMSLFSGSDGLIDIRLQDGTVLVQGLSYQDLSDFEYDVLAGSVDLQMFNQAGELIFDPRPIEVTGGDLITLVAAGNSQNESIQLYAQYNFDAGFLVTGTESRLFLAHLASSSATTADSALTVRLDGQLLIEEFVYGDSLPYQSIEPGTYNLEITRFGSSVPIVTQQITILAETDHSFFIGGDGVKQPIELYSVVDTSPPLGYWTRIFAAWPPCCV